MRDATLEEGVERGRHRPHFQEVVHNSLNGGVERWFAPVEDAVRIARQAVRRMRENFWLSAAYNVVSVPVALMVGLWSNRKGRPTRPLAVTAGIGACGLVVMAV